MRSTSLIALPTILFFLFAAAWSVGWLYIAGNAEQALDKLLAEQADAGRSLTCLNRTRNGYPFRLQFTCVDPRLTITEGPVRLTLTARQLLGMSAAFNSGQFIFELAGPIAVQRTEQGVPTDQITIETKTARASLSLTDGRMARTSLVVTGISATLSQLRNAKKSQATATRFAAHIRLGEDDTADVALQLDDVSASGAIPLALNLGEKWDMAQAALLASFLRAGDFAASIMENAPLLPWIRAWRDRGGKIQLQRLSVDAPGLRASLSGTANLTPAGLLAGTFDATFADPNALFDRLVSRGVLTKGQVQLAAAAVGLLAKPGPNGQGVVLPVRIVDGTVYLGPVQVAQVPSVN